MKKVYLFSLTVFAAGVLNAQQATTMENMQLLPTLNQATQTNVRPTQSQDRAPGDAIYANDFSIAADWNTPADANGYAFVVGGQPADLTNYMGDMASTTAANGFGSFSGVTLLLNPPFTAQSPYLELAQPFDCTNNPGVTLEFEQRYRAFNTDETIIQISNDGGTVWTDYLVNDQVTTNAAATQNTISLNISSVAANQAAVMLRFVWIGSDDQQFGAGYGWCVDDLNIYESYNDNIVQEGLYLGDIITAYEYTKIPQTQAGMLTVQSALYNGGLNTPTALVNHVIVTDVANTVVFDGTGGTLSGTLASAEYDTLTYVTTLDMATLALGVYKVTNIIEFGATDEDPSNNTLFSYFEITENTYSHYTDTLTGFFTNPGRNNTQTYDESTFGAMFEINNAATIHGINLYVSAGPSSGIINTTTDNLIQVRVFENTTDFNAPTPVASYAYSVADLTMDEWNTLNFHLPDASSNTTGSLDLLASGSYRVVVTCEEGKSFWTVGNQPDTDFSGIQQTANGWFSLGSEPAIELNFDQALTVESNQALNNLSVSQNVPNPFNGSTVVSYNLNETANVSVQVMDVTGKVIATINEGTQAAGAHNITIDGSALAQGTYFYTLTAGTYQVTKRMVVSK